MRSLCFVLAACALPSAMAQSCAATPAEARAWLAASAAAPVWHETTMSDGKPLLLRLGERDGGLHLQFVKSDEGLWAEGRARVCRKGLAVQVELVPADLTFGPAAGWILRQALGRRATFSLHALEGGRLHVATAGWSADFAPGEPAR